MSSVDVIVEIPPIVLCAPLEFPLIVRDCCRIFLLRKSLIRMFGSHISKKIPLCVPDSRCVSDLSVVG